jgi:hypothetical protein
VEFSKIEAKILGHFSDKDEWEPLNKVRARETKMIQQV